MYSLVFLLVCPFAASVANALEFTSVYEWNEFKFTLPDNSSKSLNPTKFEDSYLAVTCEKVFIALHYENKEIHCSLAWLPTDATSTSPQLYPYPSCDLKGRDNCQTIQSARGLTVDRVGRLWVLDNGNAKCPPKLLIFNLKNDSVEFIHEFPHDVVNNGSRSLQLHDLVLDETENAGSLAYISVKDTHFLVFDLKRNRSWRVQINNNIIIQALALSPLKNRTHLFVSQYISKELFYISVSNLRAEEKNVTLTPVGNKTTFSNRMTMDDRGLLYFDLGLNLSVSVWNSSDSFFEKQVYQNESIEKTEPITFSLDNNGYLWVMAIYTNEPKIRIHKAEVSGKSSLQCEKESPGHSGYSIFYDNTTTPYYPLPTSVAEPKENTCSDKLGLNILNIILSCWNVFCLSSIASQIVWFQKMKKTQDRLAKTNQEPAETSIDDDEGEHIYEEIGPRSTSTRRRRAESRV
ncbi:major royal jelly protein 3-like [Cloeon dipterum]|uniref:major royal jelly protein 3-like n=1 Tax=Cloeon dipterum TaxID=197152 RepID=UPI003220747C